MQISVAGQAQMALLLGIIAVLIALAALGLSLVGLIARVFF